MKEKLIKELYDYWACTDEDLNNGLYDNLCDIINNKGEKGAEELLDWCRSEYDRAREDYMEIHSLDENDMEKIMEDNFGAYEFMYDEVPYVSDLDNIWDICNYYLDYCQAKDDEKRKLYENYILMVIYNY